MAKKCGKLKIPLMHNNAIIVHVTLTGTYKRKSLTCNAAQGDHDHNHRLKKKRYFPQLLQIPKFITPIKFIMGKLF